MRNAVKSDCQIHGPHGDTRRHANSYWNSRFLEPIIDAIEDIGRRIPVITEEPFETIHLFQRTSVAIQRGNAVSFMSTFDNDYKQFQPY